MPVAAFAPQQQPYSHNRDQMAGKARNIYRRTLYRKSLPTHPSTSLLGAIS